MKIARDKWKHFWVGVILGLTLQWMIVFLFPSYLLLASLILFVSLIVICYGFEVTSLVLKRGHYEVADAIAGTLGGMAGMLAVLVARLILI